MRIEGSLTTAGGPIAAGGTLNVDVTSLDSSVPSTAGAVVLDVTAVNPTASGFLSVYPTGSISDPATADANGTLTSNLNFAAGQTVANLVEVPLSSSGSVTIYNNAGTTGVDVDVFGYYSPLPSTGATSGLYNPISPTRVLGTDAAGQSVAQNSTTPVTVAGVDGVPSNATAVVVNLTASDATAGGYVSAYAAGSTQPTVSNLNYAAGQVVANRAVVPVGSNGQIDLYNSFGPGVTSGSVNLDVDLDGYYTGSAAESGGAFVAMSSPMRVIDTRSSMNGTSIAANSTEKFTIPSSDVPTNATAVAANVTVVPETMNPGFLTVYPTSDSSAPVASDINWTGGMIVPNFTYLPTDGTGAFNAFNNPGGAVNLVADVFGYFTPVTVSNAIEVSADPASVVAVNSSSNDTTITVEPIHDGSPVAAGDAVQLTVSPSSCGDITAINGAGITASQTASGTTGSDQELTATYQPSSTVEDCTISALEADYGESGSVVVPQTTPGNAVGLVLGSPGSALGAPASAANVWTVAPTTTPVPVTATVTSQSTGSAVANDTVTFTTTSDPSSPNACGELSASSGTTTASGAASVDYLPSSVTGFCTITATDTSGASTTLIVDQTDPLADFTSGVPSVTLTADPTTVQANSASTSSLTATVASNGATNSTDDVMFFSQGGSDAACGTVSPSSVALSSASGTADSTYTSSSVAGTCQLYAIESADAQVSAVNTSENLITQSSAVYSISASANPTSLVAGSGATSTVTVTLTNDGAPVSGVEVTLACDPSVSNNACVGYDTAQYTNSSGEAVFTYTVGSTVGFATLLAEQAGTSNSTTVNIAQTNS